MNISRNSKSLHLHKKKCFFFGATDWAVYILKRLPYLNHIESEQV